MSEKVKVCIVCGEQKFETYCQGLIRCTRCTLVVAEEIPSAAELDELYQEKYFFGMEYSDYKADRPALEQNFKKRLKKLGKHFSKNSDVIEIGSAYGYFLNMLKNKTKSHLGFDVSTDGVSFSKNELGVNATNTDFMDYHFRKGSVDMVVMWDVVEHLTHPDKYIEKSAEILREGGCLALTTGDISKLIPRLRGAKWRMIHPPTHVYYFDKKTITKLLEKNGFQIESVRYQSTYRNVGSVANQLISNRKALNKSSKLLEVAQNIAQKSRLSKLNFPLNTFDIMEVIAIKNA